MTPQEIATQTANELVSKGHPSSFETLYSFFLKKELKRSKGKTAMTAKDIRKMESAERAKEPFTGITYEGVRYNHFSDYQAAVNKNLMKNI